MVEGGRRTGVVCWWCLLMKSASPAVRTYSAEECPAGGVGRGLRMSDDEKFAARQGMTDEVLYARDGRLGQILLNRPKVINVLTAQMVTSVLAQLQDWAQDDAVSTVSIQGAGERGLWAGNDVRALREGQRARCSSGPTNETGATPVTPGTIPSPLRGPFGGIPRPVPTRRRRPPDPITDGGRCCPRSHPQGQQQDTLGRFSSRT